MLIPIKEIIESSFTSTGANGYVGNEIKKFINNEKINGSKMDFEQRLKNLKERRSDIHAQLDWNKSMMNAYRNPEPVKPAELSETKHSIVSKKIYPKDLNNPYNRISNQHNQHNSYNQKINIKA